MESDFELLERWRGGDRGAGNALFERHFDSVYRFFSRKSNADVSDLVQRTFLACVEGRERFRGDSSFRTYLFGIARNELLRHWRKRAKLDVLDFGVTSIHDVDPSPSTLALRREQDRILLEALRRIPVDLQIALELYHWEGLRGPQIAQVLGVPEGTVRSRLRRALELLRARVREVSTSKELLRSTLSGLDGWAKKIEAAARGEASGEG